MDHDLTGLMMMPEGLFNPNPCKNLYNKNIEIKKKS